MVLFHYPDTWLEFARWHQHGGGGGAPAALAVLEKGRRALPTALALHFAAADLHESLGDAPAAKAIHEELVQGLEAGSAGAPAGAGAAPSPPPPPAAQSKPEGGEGADQQQQPADGAAAAAGQQQAAPEAKQEAAAGAGATPPPDAQQAQQAGSTLGEEAGTLAWIQYMRFARRTEGIMAARKVGSRGKGPALCELAEGAQAGIRLTQVFRLPRPCMRPGALSAVKVTGGIDFAALFPTSRPPAALCVAAALHARAQVARHAVGGVRRLGPHGVAP